MSYLLNKRSDSKDNLSTRNKASKHHSAPYAPNFNPAKPIQLPPDTGSWTLQGPTSNVPLGAPRHTKGSQMSTGLTNPLDKVLMGKTSWPIGLDFWCSLGWWFQQHQSEVVIKPISAISRGNNHWLAISYTLYLTAVLLSPLTPKF